MFIKVISENFSRVRSVYTDKKVVKKIAGELSYLIGEFQWIERRGKVESPQFCRLVSHFFNTSNKVLGAFDQAHWDRSPESLKSFYNAVQRHGDGVWVSGEKASSKNLCFGNELYRLKKLSLEEIDSLSRERRRQAFGFGYISDYEVYRDRVVMPFLRAQVEALRSALDDLSK